MVVIFLWTGLVELNPTCAILQQTLHMVLRRMLICTMIIYHNCNLLCFEGLDIKIK